MKGFLTLEMMIAMALILMSLSAILLVNFGNQNMLLAGQTNNEAMLLAQQGLEAAQAEARTDFRLVNPVATTSVQNGMYKTWTSVAPGPDPTEYVTKAITSYVSWTVKNISYVTSLSSLVSNYQSDSNDSCNSYVVGNWQNPTLQSYAFNSLVGDANVYTITDIEAYNGKLYVTTSNSSVNERTFFIFDLSDPLQPHLLGSLDNDPVNNTGLMHVALAGAYAFAASASSFTKGQLQVISVSNSAAPLVVFTYKIPTSAVPTAGLGNTIFYAKGYVFLGLKATTAGASEFNIIDVHIPTSPHRVGGYSLNAHDTNAIYVKDAIAYLVHPTDATQKQQLTLLDSNDTANPQPISGGNFYINDANANGKSVFTVGNTIYLGTTISSSKPEFYAIATSAPSGYATATPTNKDIGSSIVSLVVRDYLAFLLTTKQGSTPGQLQLIDLTSGQSNSVTLPGAGATGAAMSCEGNYVYVASNDSSGKGYITAITGS